MTMGRCCTGAQEPPRHAGSRAAAPRAPGPEDRVPTAGSPRLGGNPWIVPMKHGKIMGKPWKITEAMEV